MLAHYPQRPSHPLYDYPLQHQSLDHEPFDPSSYKSSPSLSVQTPSYTHSPSPSYLAGKDLPQFHFDTSTVPAYCDSVSSVSEGSGFYSPPYSNTTSAGLSNPPIRVHSSSSAPAYSTSYDSQSSMLSDAVGSGQWSLLDGMGHVHRPSSYSPSAPGVSTHQRLPSASSVASNGPQSPFSLPTSHPHILHPDAYSSHDFDPSWDTTFDQSQAKVNPLSFADDTYLASALQTLEQQPFDPVALHEARMAMVRSLQDQPGDEDGSAREYVTQGRSLSGVDQPSSLTSNGQFTDGDYSQPDEFRNAMPKLDRTMSNMCEDELYNPVMYANADANPQSQPQTRPIPPTDLLSPHRKVFSERLQAASQSHEQTRTHSPAVSSTRSKSPFKPNSPFAPPADSFDEPPTRLGSVAQLREQQKAEADAQAQRLHAERVKLESVRPKTISPKEAMLDYVETAEDGHRPLFSAEEANSYVPSRDEDVYAEAGLGNHRRSTVRKVSPKKPTPSASHFTFVPPTVPGSVQARQSSTVDRRRPLRTAHGSNPNMEELEFPTHLMSMESSVSEVPPADAPKREIQRPMQSTMADSGTYTCTYHGCPLRFETPAKLQKHKREGHRQNTPAHSTVTTVARTSPPSDSSSGTTHDDIHHAPLPAHSQAGPHRCTRPNPTTGKPCNTIFSRPYDLTRHEDTIHNNRKQKVRCRICEAVGEEKMFSRHDALTRHLRVVHPEVLEAQGRRGRRAD